MEKKIFNIIVPTDSHDARVDKFLQLHLVDFSRTRSQNLIREGCVKINKNTIKEASKKIKKLDRIEVNFPEPK